MTFSPRAEHVRRPPVTTLSPTLGLSHLHFEGMLNASRLSPNPYDFALVCLLRLLGLPIMEAAGLDIDALGEEQGHRVMCVLGKSTNGRAHPNPARGLRQLQTIAGVPIARMHPHVLRHTSVGRFSVAVRPVNHGSVLPKCRARISSRRRPGPARGERVSPTPA